MSPRMSMKFGTRSSVQGCRGSRWAITSFYPILWASILDSIPDSSLQTRKQATERSHTAKTARRYLPVEWFVLLSPLTRELEPETSERLLKLNVPTMKGDSAINLLTDHGL